ncbi:MAG: hypothetical protein RSH52_19220, partial [Janthinobacterium sp.]
MRWKPMLLAALVFSVLGPRRLAARLSEMTGVIRAIAEGEGNLRQRLDTAIAAVERGAKLSSHLLAFARRQPLQPVVADLARVVRNMDALLRRALGEAIDIVLVGGGGLWNTLVDRSQIENV